MKIRPADWLKVARASEGTQVDCASIVAFRVIFGLLGILVVVRFFAHGWIGPLYVAPDHHFTYLGFRLGQTVARLGDARPLHRAGRAEPGNRGRLPPTTVRRAVLHRVHIRGTAGPHDLPEPLLPDELGQPVAGYPAHPPRNRSSMDDLDAACPGRRRVHFRRHRQDQPRLAVPCAAHAHLALPARRSAVARLAASGNVDGIRHELGRSIV